MSTENERIPLIRAGLILEGGGMRGVYTAGVLDLLMEEGLWFQNIYGVSAGAGHGCSYVSRQRGRAIKAVLDYVKDPRYASLRSLVKTGDYFGARMIYQEIPRNLLPFDYDAYCKSGMRLYTVVFNCRTGETEYLHARDLREQMIYVQASSSLPLLSRMVRIGENLYLDGGIGDAIPAARSVLDGNRKNLIVLTRHRGYRKGYSRAMKALKVRYRAYPKLMESLLDRHERYNAQLAFAYREEAEGRALILQPKEPVGFRRFEKDTDRLKALYENGYADAASRLAEIKALFA